MFFAVGRGWELQRRPRVPAAVLLFDRKLKECDPGPSGGGSDGENIEIYICFAKKKKKIRQYYL